MTKPELEKHLKALTFRYDKLAQDYAKQKDHYENIYKHYRKVFWRFYFL